MRLPAGSRDRKLRVLFGTGAMQARDEIARQERTVRRRARPPASSTPGVRGVSVVTLGALARVSRGFFFDEGEVLVVDDALLARQRDEALAPRAPDQRQSDLPRQIDAPRGKA